ncbi:hypothetical protein HDU96_008148, partial [Phlyctochytrium bullatum]
MDALAAADAARDVKSILARLLVLNTSANQAANGTGGKKPACSAPPTPAGAAWALDALRLDKDSIHREMKLPSPGLTPALREWVSLVMKKDLFSMSLVQPGGKQKAATSGATSGGPSASEKIAPALPALQDKEYLEYLEDEADDGKYKTDDVASVASVSTSSSSTKKAQAAKVGHAAVISQTRRQLEALMADVIDAILLPKEPHPAQAKGPEGAAASSSKSSPSSASSGAFAVNTVSVASSLTFRSPGEAAISPELLHYQVRPTWIQDLGVLVENWIKQPSWRAGGADGLWPNGADLPPGSDGLNSVPMPLNLDELMVAMDEGRLEELEGNLDDDDLGDEEEELDEDEEEDDEDYLDEDDEDYEDQEEEYEDDDDDDWSSDDDAEDEEDDSGELVDGLCHRCANVRHHHHHHHNDHRPQSRQSGNPPRKGATVPPPSQAIVEFPPFIKCLSRETPTRFSFPVKHFPLLLSLYECMGKAIKAHVTATTGSGSTAGPNTTPPAVPTKVESEARAYNDKLRRLASIQEALRRSKVETAWFCTRGVMAALANVDRERTQCVGVQALGKALKTLGQQEFRSFEEMWAEGVERIVGPGKGSAPSNGSGAGGKKRKGGNTSDASSAAPMDEAAQVAALDALWDQYIAGLKGQMRRFREAIVRPALERVQEVVGNLESDLNAALGKVETSALALGLSPEEQRRVRECVEPGRHGLGVVTKMVAKCAEAYESALDAREDRLRSNIEALNASFRRDVPVGSGTSRGRLERVGNREFRKKLKELEADLARSRAQVVAEMAGSVCPLSPIAVIGAVVLQASLGLGNLLDKVAHFESAELVGRAVRKEGLLDDRRRILRTFVEGVRRGRAELNRVVGVCLAKEARRRLDEIMLEAELGRLEQDSAAKKANGAGEEGSAKSKKKNKKKNKKGNKATTPEPKGGLDDDEDDVDVDEADSAVPDKPTTAAVPAPSATKKREPAVPASADAAGKKPSSEPATAGTPTKAPSAAPSASASTSKSSAKSAPKSTTTSAPLVNETASKSQPSGTSKATPALPTTVPKSTKQQSEDQSPQQQPPKPQPTTKKGTAPAASSASTVAPLPVPPGAQAGAIAPAHSPEAKHAGMKAEKGKTETTKFVETGAKPVPGAAATKPASAQETPRSAVGITPASTVPVAPVTLTETAKVEKASSGASSAVLKTNAKAPPGLAVPTPQKKALVTEEATKRQTPEPVLQTPPEERAVTINIARTSAPAAVPVVAKPPTPAPEPVKSAWQPIKPAAPISLAMPKPTPKSTSVAPSPLAPQQEQTVAGAAQLSPAESAPAAIQPRKRGSIPSALATPFTPSGQATGQPGASSSDAPSSSPSDGADGALAALKAQFVALEQQLRNTQREIEVLRDENSLLRRQVAIACEEADRWKMVANGVMAKGGLPMMMPPGAPLLGNPMAGAGRGSLEGTAELENGHKFLAGISGFDTFLEEPGSFPGVGLNGLKKPSRGSFSSSTPTANAAPLWTPLTGNSIWSADPQGLSLDPSTASPSSSFPSMLSGSGSFRAPSPALLTSQSGANGTISHPPGVPPPTRMMSGLSLESIWSAPATGLPSGPSSSASTMAGNSRPASPPQQQPAGSIAAAGATASPMPIPKSVYTSSAGAIGAGLSATAPPPGLAVNCDGNGPAASAESDDTWKRRGAGSVGAV